ncbi:MAG TPA: ABC transporter ATP-binding protein [Syntrophorhabdaceae bacterium]|nr:ABC transporter ATP-binding protein [Syntrophorhabdaceae bacterium]
MIGGIDVSGLGKAYKQYPTRWSRFAEWLSMSSRPRHHLKWVLQDINFTINPGEAVGIIGVNGAGKSTLLKLIAGTIRPTTGKIRVDGRVSAMLELGIGFHPDFTGRQNVLMAAQLQGVDVKQIPELMPEIEAFADIGTYIDEPVRIYSSGMQARLAFSVATCIKPDILIVDEVLSVGDIAFQAKCMRRMDSLIDSGVSVLFVSHALNQVRKFCTKALYLSGGRAKAFGPVDIICDEYQNDLALVGIGKDVAAAGENGSGAEHIRLNARDVRRDENLRKNSADGGPGGSLDLEFLSFDVLDMHGSKVTGCNPGEKICFRAAIIANRSVSSGSAVGLLIADKNGYPLLSCNSNFYDVRLPDLRKGNLVVVTWVIDWPFYSGEFRIDIGIKPDAHGSEFYDRVFCAATLFAVPPMSLLRENFGGYLHIHADVKAKILSSD